MVNVGVNFASKISPLGVELPSKEKNQELHVSGIASSLLAPDAKDVGVKNVTDESELLDITKAIDMLNQRLLVKSTSLVFEFDDVQDPPIVKVVDKVNGDIIREIPSKELREIAKALNNIADIVNSNSGLLLDEQT